VLRVDHVVRAVPDLDREGERLLASFGLASVAGGIHPGWGTANRIVPLGATYLELIAVAHPGPAEASVFGRAVAERASGGGGWLALCLADDHLEATARRLSLEVRPGARTLPDGRTIRWRGAGLEDPRRTPDLPFFIEWESQDVHPGRTALAHPRGVTSLTNVEVAGDEARFRAWTGSVDPAVSFAAREPAGVLAVTLSADGDDLELR
jgi:Glyoxalase-like domain